MGKVLTTDKLIKSIKRRMMIPTSQSTFSTDDFLSIINEELSTGTVPYVLSTHEEYLVYSEDLVLSEGTTSFRIPSRAIGNKLRALFLITGDNTLNEMTKVAIDDLHFYQNTYNDQSQSYTYYIEGDEVQLIGETPSATTIRIKYYISPSDLVEDKYASVVQSINRTTGEIVVDKVPTTFTSESLLEFTDSQNPNKLYSFDVAMTGFNNTTKVLTFSTSDIPANLKVGDFITISGTSIVPQLPSELHHLLAQRAAIHCLGSIGSADQINLAEAKLKQMEKNVSDLIDNRVENSPDKVVNLNSPLRNQLSRYWRKR